MALLLITQLAWPEPASDMPKNWSGVDLRRVHTVYFSPDWVENRGQNFDPRQYVRDLKAAGAGTIEFMMKDHYGDAKFKTAGGSFYGRDLLTPLVEESHAQGMKLFAYYSVGWDNWAFYHHPEWRLAGSRLPEKPGFLSVDVQSGYREYMLQQLREIAAVPVDGWFLDVCCGPPPFGNATPETQHRVYETIKSLRPASLVTWNGAGDPQDERLWDSAFSDFSSTEGGDAQSQTLVAKFLQRLDKPFTIESPGSYRGWNGGGAFKPAAVLQVEGAVVSANGGALAEGLNPYPDGTVQPAEIANLGQLWRFIQEREQYFVHTTSAAEVCVWLPSEPKPSALGMRGLNEALLNYQIDYRFVVSRADLRKCSLVLLPDNARLDASDQGRIQNFVEQGGKLLAFAEGGRGLETVLGIGRKGSFPYSGTYCVLMGPEVKRNMPDTPLLIRGQALRISATQGTSLAKVRVPIAEYTLYSFVGEPNGGLLVNPPGPTTEYDMIVHHGYGRGEAVYVAAPMVEDLDAAVVERNGGLWQKQLLSNLIDELLPNKLVEVEAPPGIALVTNWQNGRLIISLIDLYAAIPGQYAVGKARIPKATGVKLRIDEARLGGKLQRILMQPSNKALRWERNDHKVNVEVPNFTIHAFVVIENSEPMSTLPRGTLRPSSDRLFVNATGR